MQPEPDVLIAGAGPTGLALACGLLASGVAARVVDEAVAEADRMTGEAVLADVTRLLGERTGCAPSQLTVTYRDGPLGRQTRGWFSWQDVPAPTLSTGG